MPVPEDMRRTVAVKLRLTEKAADVLRDVKAGLRSGWVSKLLWEHRNERPNQRSSSPQKRGEVKGE